MSKVVKGYDRAVEILKSTKGIILDIKNRTQTWHYGQIYSEKAVNAGKFLDKYNADTNGEFKTTWLTKDGELPVCFGGKR